MPVYVYECQKCGNNFELLQAISDPPRKRCPECRGKVRKVITPVGIVFKGSGFYCTDSRGNSSIAPGGGNGGKKKTEDTKPESKPADKTEAKTEAKTD